MLGMPGRAEEPPTTERIERLVRDFVISSEPGLKTNTTFFVDKINVKGLWEALQVEVFDIHYGHEGYSIGGFVGLYHDGKVTQLTANFGGFGMMSGTVKNGAFYYTSSYGSGRHRSEIGMLRRNGAKLEQSRSEPFDDMDVFVSGGTNSGVRVFLCLGSQRGYGYFNHWENGQEIGTVEETGPARLRILGRHGDVVKPGDYSAERTIPPISAENWSPPVGTATNFTLPAGGVRR